VLLYSVSNSLSQLTWFDRTGNRTGVVGEPAEYDIFRLSPNGRRVATQRDRAGGSDLWVQDVERGGVGRLTLSSNLNLNPAWSPDGRNIVFTAGPGPNLFHTESSGAGAVERVTNSHGIQFSTDWSRDGHWIMYHELTTDAARDLWVVPVTADGSPVPNSRPKLYVRTPFNEAWGRFSPESPPHWVAYQSDLSGRYEIYVQSFPEPHGKFQISISGGQYPVWAPSGRELFYVSLDNKLMGVSLKFSAESVEPSPARELFTLPITETGLIPYDTADGQRFLVRATTSITQPLNVIVNWPALLKNPAPAP
jgi:Tol biopolymer transport system component